MIVVITLLVCAVIALRGYLPGLTESEDGPSAPSALAVALMPVLLTVSIVILLAGVIASQHRLPLAMPEPDPDTDRQPWRLGRAGLIVLAMIAAVALLFAITSAIFFVGLQPETESTVAPPTGTTATPTNSGETPPADPSTATEPAELAGTALVLAIIAAVTLVVVAIAGLVVVAITTRRKPGPEPEPLAPAVETAADSLARAAEMGLAAMSAPGQDPRTAIIACYVAMERGLSAARSAAPLASDTPMEVLARAFERGALHDASARELVALFEEARFSPHSMLEWQRMRAEQLLRIVLADLQGEVVRS
ncbi:DUF4129 domain-containing protein [Nocardia cyriacigeorgica]|uniref:DUF4129 domain-containing protein n=1 Tax=Nocardia cyriacigeorgica TaxID=135487 RepID=A0A6P1D632_9NOCA|nr:DUF4129 domain-containing protein [Nocardia cyriacigeorgica]NEW42114.1 DUF4129 domain-containing protein [Nocardia cyriacigeorgica]NEW44844.1 DUF4129 domain-containing protein [Nocardia cyriacigeorgica]NEW53080.1 DUF4129 domain-containing protein [Nocardia cyriacigeorgica]NEW57125.1 DUF4129 domain-containing protein [Nocardia cyriacigeorgica]